MCDLCASCSTQKLVCVALARLHHIAKRQAVARQCHDGNAGLSAQVLALGLAAVLLAWPALVRCSVPVVHGRGVFHTSSCQVHRKCLPTGKRPPESPGSRSLHRQWPHPLVPVRRRHPKLGLSACSKHVALATELQCANESHSFTFSR